MNEQKAALLMLVGIGFLTLWWVIELAQRAF